MLSKTTGIYYFLRSGSVNRGLESQFECTLASLSLTNPILVLVTIRFTEEISGDRYE